MQTALNSNSLSHSTKKRDVAVDLIKTIAIIGVIIIHISTGANANPIGSLGWLTGNFFGSITRASVPLFLMCSGTLFLNAEKELPLKKLYFKNILRLIIAMVFWATAYKVYHLLRSGNLSVQNLWSDFKNVLFFNQEFHLYYIHIMLLIYVLLPVVRVITKNADKKTLEYALIVWFILAVVFPTFSGFWPLNMLSGIPIQWRINLAYGSIGYCILGHYLKKYPLRTSVSVISAAVGLAITYGGTVFMSVKDEAYCTIFLQGMSVGVCFLAIGIYGICVKIAPMMGKVMAFFTNYTSKASFCIYLVHMFILYEFGNFKFNISSMEIPEIISIPLVTVCCFILSTFVYFVLSHIPVVKKWLV